MRPEAAEVTPEVPARARHRWARARRRHAAFSRRSIAVSPLSSAPQRPHPSRDSAAASVAPYHGQMPLCGVHLGYPGHLPSLFLHCALGCQGYCVTLPSGGARFRDSPLYAPMYPHRRCIGVNPSETSCIMLMQASSGWWPPAVLARQKLHFSECRPA